MTLLKLASRRTFASLRRHRNYRLFFYGQLTSVAGTWMQNIAMAWLVVDLAPHSRGLAVGLLDENAAAHMAFGSGFAKTRTLPLGSKRYGVNRSKTHIDVMIGTDALQADGITQSGKRVSLVSDGTWRF